MLRSRFCPLCAAPLVRRVPDLDDRPRHVCSACGFVLYMNPKIAAGTIPVDRSGRVALIRRGVEPGLGRWSWPCGYVEMDEDVPSCALRETREESGLEVALGPLLGLYSYPARDDPRGGDVSSTGIVLACYRARAEDTVLTAGDDAIEAAWFAPDEIPWDDLAFDSSHRALRDLLAER